MEYLQKHAGNCGRRLPNNDLTTCLNQAILALPALYSQPTLKNAVPVLFIIYL